VSAVSVRMHGLTSMRQTAMVQGCLHHLQASHEVIQAAKRLENSNGMVQRAGFQPASKLARGAAAHKQLLGQEVHAEQYLRLLCQFDPPAVLPFLQSHDSYQCDSSLRVLCLLRGEGTCVPFHVSCGQCNTLSQ